MLPLKMGKQDVRNLQQSMSLLKNDGNKMLVLNGEKNQRTSTKEI